MSINSEPLYGENGEFVNFDTQQVVDPDLTGGPTIPEESEESEVESTDWEEEETDNDEAHTSENVAPLPHQPRLPYNWRG